MRQRDAQVRTGLGKDPQLAAIYASRRFFGDKLIRTVKPHPLLDPAAGPLIAVRLHVLTRKTWAASRPTCPAARCRPAARRCPACTPRARSPASAAAGCTATARWRGRSWAAASSPAAPRAEPAAAEVA